jgi:hypothetical protein
MRVLGRRQRHHRKPVRKRRQMLFQFMWRTARGNEMHFVEIESPVCCPGYSQVAGMNGVKRAAKYRNPSRLVFCRRTLRLRSRQSASRVFPNPILSRNPASGTRIIP